MKLDRTIQIVQLLGVLAIALLSCQTLPDGDRPTAKSEPAARPSPSPTVQESQAQTYQVVPGSVYDGDTLRITEDGTTQTKIRLRGVDAP